MTTKQPRLNKGGEKMELRCEVCGRVFEAAKRRPIDICAECIDELEPKGLGPVQLLGRREVKDLVLRIIRRER